MLTKMKDTKEHPLTTVHYIRYITKNNVATTLCDETFKSIDWLYTFNEEVNCPACLLATIKREKVIRRPQKKDMSTKFYIGLGIILVFAALYGTSCLFGIF